MEINLEFRTEWFEGGWRAVFTTPDGRQTISETFGMEKEAEAQILLWVAWLNNMPGVVVKSSMKGSGEVQ